MPRKSLNKLIARVLPGAKRLSDRWYLRPFRAVLEDPALWHLNRRGAVRAVALGLFVALLPIPGHTVIVALVALWLRVNLPLSMISIFVTNPVTMGPIFYAAYKLGAVLLGTPPQTFDMELSWDWVAGTLVQLWQPLVLGSLIIGAALSAAGYWTLNTIWILSLRHRFATRHD